MAERSPDDRLHLEFVRVARLHTGRLAMADTTGQSLTFGRALLAAFAFSRVIARHARDETHVGTLLPATVGGALANLAISMAGKIPVNLNFTIGQEALDAAVAHADIRMILTSRTFLEKIAMPEAPSMRFLEEMRQEVSLSDKLHALVDARLTPLSLLKRRFAGGVDKKDAVASIIFSSGSTGEPKGIVLTHANILANVDSLAQIFPVGPGDCFIGVLPFFHSFGFTGTLWFPLLRGSAVAYHPNPMDAKAIGELAEQHQATLIMSTPTFCNSYVRRCTRKQFKSIKWAIVGAEKLREPLATDFQERFGIGLLEGYGMTEMAPVVSCNLPDLPDRVRTRAGSVGLPIPGVEAKIIDRDTLVDLPVGDEGLLAVRGENLMRGYLKAPERTAEVIRDGWYVTGDIARLDAEGFIFITDRLSRFSKVAGEMVPHVKIEDAINAILGETASVVTAVPDQSKGERLIAFYSRPDITPDVLWSRLSATALPKLWIPRRDSLVPLDAIPTLGTGKVDLRRVKELASERQSADA
jgi:acyl-[acyl-carrier-protein]-phospholipid O-acyltransferase/long-chain-fatty-acid--[acyl-carrier-protein] ligase